VPPADREPTRGALILVVGPSGAGKDSLIAGARTRFANDGRIAFARRCITRPADPAGEAHETISVDEFERRRNADAFMLSWRAHGLRYGIPGSYEFDLAAGRSIVANVSRTVIDDARRRYRPLSVIHVTASPDILAARLKARGRENLRQQEARLRRPVAASPVDDDVAWIRNDAALEDALREFNACLTAIVRGERHRRRPDGENPDL
jgi:phosphonate metabolism protein PhnN/1,5-bisphosphokinase (PRPP-forming)